MQKGVVCLYAPIAPRELLSTIISWMTITQFFYSNCKLSNVVKITAKSKNYAKYQK